MASDKCGCGRDGCPDCARPRRQGAPAADRQQPAAPADRAVRGSPADRQARGGGDR